MATFYMDISDGKEGEVEIQADNAMRPSMPGLTH